MEQSNEIPTPTPTAKVGNKKSVFRDFLEAFIIALLVALPIKFWIASPFIVVGTSMYPTFKGSDYLIIDKLVYKWSDPQRGDVVVFTPPINTKEYFIKRIIAIPGDTIQIQDNSVKIINKENPDGYILNEPYISSHREGDTETTLGDGEYFVMGDNRAVSSDSRVWGPITKEEISGRADVRLFPIPSIALMPGSIEIK